MKTFLTLAAVCIALTIGVSAQDAKQDAMPKELAAIQGAWQVVSMNGQNPADQGAEVALVFTGSKYQVVINGAVDESGTFKLDAAKKPMSLDLTILEGNDAGKVQLGIVEITGDVAKGLLGQPGSTARPADFNSNDGVVSFIAKKAK